MCVPVLFPSLPYPAVVAHAEIYAHPLYLKRGTDKTFRILAFRSQRNLFRDVTKKVSRPTHVGFSWGNLYPRASADFMRRVWEREWERLRFVFPMTKYRCARGKASYGTILVKLCVAIFTTPRFAYASSCDEEHGPSIFQTIQPCAVLEVRAVERQRWGSKGGR